jgi:hypothetical protein
MMYQYSMPCRRFNLEQEGGGDGGRWWGTKQSRMLLFVVAGMWYGAFMLAALILIGPLAGGRRSDFTGAARCRHHVWCCFQANGAVSPDFTGPDFTGPDFEENRRCWCWGRRREKKRIWKTGIPPKRKGERDCGEKVLGQG